MLTLSETLQVLFTTYITQEITSTCPNCGEVTTRTETQKNHFCCPAGNLGFEFAQEEQGHCDTCKDAMQVTRKRLTPWNPATVLVIVLERFEKEGHKVSQTIDIPDELCWPGKTKYRLACTICHEGDTVLSQQYSCLVFRQNATRFDGRVVQVMEQTRAKAVIEKDAHILFYVKVVNNKLRITVKATTSSTNKKEKAVVQEDMRNLTRSSRDGGGVVSNKEPLDLATEQAESIQKLWKGGLVNKGNKCYAIAVLSAFYRIDSFRKLFLSLKVTPSEASRATDQENLSAFKALSHFLKSPGQVTYESLLLQLVKLPQLGSLLGNKEQQDAEEFFSVRTYLYSCFLTPHV